VRAAASGRKGTRRLGEAGGGACCGTVLRAVERASHGRGPVSPHGAVDCCSAAMRRPTRIASTAGSITCSRKRSPSKRLCRSAAASSSPFRTKRWLYDVTSTYFEGLAEANPRAQRAIPAIIAPMIARRDVAVGSAFRSGSPKVTLVSAFLTNRPPTRCTCAGYARALVIKSGSSLDEESDSGRFRCICQSYGFF
jgi:hypothetical protein